MEDQKTEEQNKTPDQANEVQKEPSSQKTKSAKSLEEYRAMLAAGTAPSLRGKSRDQLKFEEWVKNDYIKNIRDDIKALLRESKVSNILTTIIPDDRYLPLTESEIESILTINRIKSDKHPLKKLLRDVQQLERACGLKLAVKKLGEGRFDLELSTAMTHNLIYEVDTDTLEDLGSDRIVTTRKYIFRRGFTHGQRGGTILSCPINEIEIKDVAKVGKKQSPFFKVFSQLTNEVYPTLIRYKHTDPRGDATKKLFVYLPPALNASQLYNAYAEQLTETRDEFYDVRVGKGRPPQSREEMEQNIRRAVRELGEETKNIFALDPDQLIKGICDKIKRKKTKKGKTGYEPSYIKRRFSPVIQDEGERVFEDQVMAVKVGLGDISGKSTNKIISEIASKLGTHSRKLIKNFPALRSLVKDWGKETMNH